jgi:hypothetical protein
MTTQYKAVGYEMTVKSKRQITHAVIFWNKGREIPVMFATWNSSLELAEKYAKQINSRSHIEVVEIVEVEEI